ncbi:hypothetical protein M8J77_012246 [Diaphorina citri]|nr:hypothetical protein M8J77_012246 [Diaphorina citri]
MSHQPKMKELIRLQEILTLLQVREDCKQLEVKPMQLLQFHTSIGKSLLSKKKPRKQGHPSVEEDQSSRTPTSAHQLRLNAEERRYDNIGHWSKYGPKERCKVCTVGLTTFMCEKSLDRFIGRRGLPVVIHSDNGSNFRGAARYLSETQNFLSTSRDEISVYLRDREVAWNHIPSRSPN